MLKEAVEKTTWAAPEDKIPILEEMIEVYRDRLKLDVMVVNAFNQILSIQPDNFDAADALAAQYETMKRWPDLIALLRKKAAVVESAEDKIALYAARREPVPREVLEPGGGDQGLRDDPRARSRQQRGARLRQADVREAPRLGEADRGQPARDRQADRTRGERKNRRIEVAKLASEKMKKPSVSIELWQKVLADDADNMEALGELEKLYEREKAWSELGAVLERQVAASDDATRKSAIYVKLGILFTEKVHNAAQATAAWQALLALEPENRRAQDALKKLYLQSEGLGRAGGVLRRAEQVGRATSACSSARPRPRTRPGASACGTRSPSSIAIA